MSKEMKAYVDKDFSVTLEEQKGVLFIHCDADHFSKAVLRQMRMVFEEIKMAAAYYGWKDIVTYTPNPKFAKLMPGWVYMDTVYNGDEEYEVIKWELN